MAKLLLEKVYESKFFGCSFARYFGKLRLDTLNEFLEFLKEIYSLKSRNSSANRKLCQSPGQFFARTGNLYILIKSAVIFLCFLSIL